MKLLAVAGARPNFVKIAPLMREMRSRRGLESVLVHTGQHYDERMSRLFFEELDIPRPDVDLEVGSGTHAVQTAEIMKRFDPVLRREKPDAVLVVGDVNSTIACALTAAKEGVPVAHVEAGLRSFDRTMPEEINRVLTDRLSDWLFATERSGAENLRREGIASERIFLVGNVMIDTLRRHRERSEQSAILETVRVSSRGYAVLTLHRPGTVDQPERLGPVLTAIAELSRELPVIFPVHPRTRRVLESGAGAWLACGGSDIRTIEPLGYLDFLKLLAHARLVLTDSGGIQEETTVLGVPCLTLRENTERPATVEEGSNVLVGLSAERILSESRRVLGGAFRPGRIPALWDGRAAVRVVDALVGRTQRSAFSEAPARVGMPDHAATQPLENIVAEPT
jgi:UDP-N-acetylglucosamine 2-epimerase (non-hydrolysing)